MTIQQFCSSRGADELKWLRITGVPKPTTGTAPIVLLFRGPSEECGCPEELWHVEGFLYLIHMEPTAGKGEIFLMAGDTEEQITSQVTTLDELRAEMFKQHAAFMQRPEN